MILQGNDLLEDWSKKGKEKKIIKILFLKVLFYEKKRQVPFTFIDFTKKMDFQKRNFL